MTARHLSSTALLTELEPTVESNLNRHLHTAKEWFPHEYVPWSQGTDFDGVLGGQPWSSEQSTLSEVSRTALVVNLLTEDNLPSYHHEIAVLFGRDGAWGTWVHRWTAEEGRHGIAIRDYLLATRVSHRNTGKISADPLCEQLLARVAADENLHMVFYRNLLTAAFELSPNETMRAVTDVVTSFQMPGHTIENFTRKSVQIAMAGIYDLRIHHDEVVAPILRNLKALDATGLSGDGEKARDELVAFLAELYRQATRFTEKRDRIQAARASRG